MCKSIFSQQQLKMASVVEVRPAQLSHVSESIIQAAAHCLNLDDAQILERSLDDFVVHELKAQMFEL